MRRPATTGFLAFMALAACSHVAPRPLAPAPAVAPAMTPRIAQPAGPAAPAAEAMPVPTPAPVAMPAPTPPSPVAARMAPVTPAAAPTQPQPVIAGGLKPKPSFVASSPATPKAVQSTDATARPPAPPPLDLAALEQRLRDTHAIGLFTKLSVKNQVDDLLGEFKMYHGGRVPPTLVDLRQRYDLLLLKVLTLLQDGDRALAASVAASRDAIWGILADREKFQKI